MDLLARALDAGRPARWVAGNAVYGQHYKLRKALEDRSVFYVPLVPMNLRVIARTGALGSEVRAGDLITALPAIAWRTRAAGAGSKHRPLPDPRTQTGCPRRPRPGRRSPLSHREKLPDLPTPNRPRPLPGPATHRLVPAHHPLDAGARPDPNPVKKGRHPAPRPEPARNQRPPRPPDLHPTAEPRTRAEPLPIAMPHQQTAQRHHYRNHRHTP